MRTTTTYQRHSRLSALLSLRSLFAVLAAVPLTFIFSAMTLVDLLLVRKNEIKAQFFPITWGRLICQMCQVRVDISGIEHLDPDATYIFVGNHASQFDIFAFQGYFPHDFRWIAKKELFRIPLFGPAMRRAGIIPIDRSAGRKAVKSLAQAAQRIRSGSSVLIFPEGTRSRDGRLMPFKSGAALLAIKSGVAVVPVGFNQTHQIMPKGALLPRPGTVYLRVGEPIDVSELTTADKQVFSERLYLEVAGLLDDCHRPASQEM